MDLDKCQAYSRIQAQSYYHSDRLRIQHQCCMEVNVAAKCPDLHNHLENRLFRLLEHPLPNGPELSSCTIHWSMVLELFVEQLFELDQDPCIC